MVTGEVLMPWTTFPSQTIAARTFTSQGLHPSSISQLVNGIKPQHNGFEARLCGDRDGVDDGDDGGAGSRRHPSPPFYSAMVTKPVFAPQRRIEAVASASLPRAGFGNAGAQASAQACARPVEVRCSLERERERAAHERHHREPTISIASH